MRERTGEEGAEGAEGAEGEEGEEVKGRGKGEDRS